MVAKAEVTVGNVFRGLVPFSATGIEGIPVSEEAMPSYYNVPIRMLGASIKREAAAVGGVPKISDLDEC
jgi:hypothetical protein